MASDPADRPTFDDEVRVWEAHISGEPPVPAQAEQIAGTWLNHRRHPGNAPEHAPQGEQEDHPSG